MKDFKDSIVNHYNTDVVIVGGGPAGICAACAAADSGVKVMLIEQYGFVGGMATAGLVAPFMTCYDAKGEQQIIRGIFKETIDRLIKIDGAKDPSRVALYGRYRLYFRRRFYYR